MPSERAMKAAQAIFERHADLLGDDDDDVFLVADLIDRAADLPELEARVAELEMELASMVEGNMADANRIQKLCNENAALSTELKREYEAYDTLTGLLRSRFPRNADGSFPDWKIEEVLRENAALAARVAELEARCMELDRYDTEAASLKMHNAALAKRLEAVIARIEAGNLDDDLGDLLRLARGEEK